MNKLQSEKSLYLLQHSNNPVQWFPWGEEAFETARRENKPIFLSIGYSTCHWCHVMERESFENASTAALMNEYFVNIKVDREERPDVDKVYMTAVQTMTGQGGWPLSVFLTPDLKPFYGGTYFPPKDAHGRPGFPTVLQKINEVWQNEKENILQSAEQLTNELRHRHPVDSMDTVIDQSLLKRAYHQIAAGYDSQYGGFGSGTKFPRPVVLNFLHRYHYRTGDEEALRMSLTTLMAMANGGLYDHLGGGFHRYSVDEQWRVPHFEKMLYDQAQLVEACLDAYQITKDEFFATVAKETLVYVLRDMTTPEGGFCSAEDADSIDPDEPSHPREGAFYIWRKSEIEKLLTRDEAAIFCEYYSVQDNGNALNDPHREFTGKNILYSPITVEQCAERCSVTPVRAVELLADAKKKLLHARSLRHRPLLDDKVIASWNGMMIGSFARAGSVFSEQRYVRAAERAMDFVLSKLFNAESCTLLRRYREGEPKFEAHLDDYAFVVSGLLDLFRSTQAVRWLSLANDLTGTMITLFWDSAEGGFYDTAGKETSLLFRSKQAYDGAEPTGNSVAIMNLLRLYHLTGNESFQKYAEKSMKYFCSLLRQSPHVMPALMSAVEHWLEPPSHLVIVPGDDDTLSDLLQPIAGNFLPHLTMILLREDVRAYVLPTAQFMREMKSLEGKTTLYYCSNFTCRVPSVDSSDVFRRITTDRTVTER
jgi:hypothetical protein